MKSLGSKNEGSISFHRSEPPMNSLDVQKIDERDNSQNEGNDDDTKDDSPIQKLISIGDENSENKNETQTIAELRTLNSNSNGSSVPLFSNRERKLSDPVELEAINGSIQSLSAISAACNSVRILPDFLIDPARPMFNTMDSERRSPSTNPNTGPLSDSDSTYHAYNVQSGNSKLPATSDLTFNSVLSGQSWVSGSANNHYHNSSLAQNPGLNNLASLNKISWRKGKWIDEEGVYTKKLIEAFNAGLLKIPSGTTLRSFLAEQLSCDPMRITKKFARSSAIGKQVFVPCDLTKTDPKVLKEVQDELNELGEKFRAKVELAQSSSIFPINTQAALAAAMRGVQGRTAPYFEGLPSDVLRNLVLAQQNQLIRNSLIHTGQIPSHADAANLPIASHCLPDMATLSSLYFGSSQLSPQHVASLSGTSSSTLGLREGDRIIPKQTGDGAPSAEKNEADVGTNFFRGENKDHQPVVGSSLASDDAAQFISRISDHQESAGQFVKPLAIPSASKPDKKLPSTSLNLNSSTVSLANISKSLYETQLNESQTQAMKHNQTFGTGLINMANFPYDLFYNQSPKYSDTTSATEVKKPRKERKSSKSEMLEGNGSEGTIKAVNGNKRQPQVQQQSHSRKSDSEKSSISCHTQLQQQQLLSKLQQEIFNNASKKSTAGEEKVKSKSTSSKKYSREHSSSSLSKQESASTKDQLSSEQQLQQHSGDLYASDLLMNFFKAANHSPMSGEKPAFNDSSQFHRENGDGDDYVNGETMLRETNDRNLTSDLPLKNGMEKLPSSNTNNNNASNGTCSDSGESNGNGHGPHKMNSKSHTTSESDSSTSTSGNEEHDQDRDRKSSSSPSSMADEAPRVSAKERNASNSDRGKRKLTAAAASTGDLQDTGSDHKSSDLTNNSQSVSDEESTDSSTRFEIDVSNSNSSNDLKDGHFDGNRIDVEEPALNGTTKLKHVNSSNNISSGNITGSSNPNTTNNNSNISSSKKRSRTSFQRSDVDEDMLIVESDEYCTLDTLQSQGETIDSNARKKLVNRMHSSPTSNPALKMLETSKSKSAYDSGPTSSVD